MADATFYLLSADHDHQDIACQLVARAYRQGKPLYLHCSDQHQAEALDQALWSFDPDSFIPHNLQGEGPRGGAPVVIGWGPGQMELRTNRPILINLAPEVPEFAVHFAQIFDFVPADEQAKAQARRRFAAYRQLGVTPTTQDLARQPF